MKAESNLLSTQRMKAARIGLASGNQGGLRGVRLSSCASMDVRLAARNSGPARCGSEYRWKKTRACFRVRLKSTCGTWQHSIVLPAYLPGYRRLRSCLRFWLSLSFDHTVATEAYDLYAATPRSAK
jgi:hypothetical protein